MWYAVYVKSRHEKKVAALLESKNVEAYVPLRKTLKQWSDRKKWVEEPVISSYVFVNILLSERDIVLRISGVVGFVRNNKEDALIADNEMNVMKSILGVPNIDVSLEGHDLRIGEVCEVVAGPLVGTKVKLCEIKGKNKVGVYIENLKMSLIFEINPAYLKQVSLCD